MTLHILSDTNHPARHVPHVLGLGREEAGVRPSITQRNSEPLTGAKGDVHPKLPRGLHDGQGHQVSRADGQGPSIPKQKFVSMFFGSGRSLRSGDVCLFATGGALGKYYESIL